MQIFIKILKNHSPTDINYQKLQYLSWYIQKDFFGSLLVPLLKIGFLLIKNVTKPLATIVLIPFELTALESAPDTTNT